MLAEVPLRHRVGTPRSPALVVFRLTSLRVARSALAWGAVFGLYVASSAFAYAGAYKTAAARAKLEATLGGNLGFNALIGPAHRIGTVAGFTAWRSLGVLGVVGAIWGLLAATRSLRGEEESGRWELLLVGGTTRRRATYQALGGLAAGLSAMWAVAAAIVVAVGRAGSVGFPVGASLYLALALTASAAMFLAVGSLTSQLAPTRRMAAGYAAVLLGVSYAVRMVADSGIGVSWLRWATPLGWVEQLRPLTSPRPAFLVPIGALTACCAVAASELAARRDLNASLVADRPSRASHTLFLGGATGLALRLSRGVFSAWAVSLGLSALLMGLIAKTVGNALTADAADRKTFAQFGYHGSGAQQYLGITFLLVATLVAFVSAGQLGHIRGEESSGRLENLVDRPLSRVRWLASRLAVSSCFVLLAGLLAGAVSWVGAATQDSGVGLPSLVGAGINVVPPALLILGVGTLAFGTVPRLAGPVAYGVLAWSFLVEIVGSVVRASHWVLDTSIFHVMAAAPAVSPNWVSSGAMTALALTAMFLGALAFRRRDLVAE